LVTAKHVVFNPTTKALVGTECSLLSYPRDPSEAGTNEFRLDLAKLNSDGNIKSHSGADVAIVKIANVNRQGAAALLAGVSAISSAPSGILGVAEANIKRFAEVLIANEVFIFGYPTSLGLKAIAQLDYAKPLLRRGIVAGKNDGLQTLVLDCPVYWGNSGGPVLEVETVDLTTKRFSVVGVVSQFVPLVETWRNQTHGYENLDVSNSGYLDIRLPPRWIQSWSSFQCSRSIQAGLLRSNKRLQPPAAEPPWLKRDVRLSSCDIDDSSSAVISFCSIQVGGAEWLSESGNVF
jgi:trypsin-like peptidase